jgi:signal transduction histidine kinase
MRRRFRDRRLHEQLFVWLALTIVATIAISVLVLNLFEPTGPAFGMRLERASEFAARQFADRWPDAAARDAFASQVAEAFGARLTLSDAAGQTLYQAGGDACFGGTIGVDVVRDGARVGRVDACMHGFRHFRPARALAVLGSVCLVLWTAAALFAHRMTRPLSLLIEATREIGGGNLGARVRLGRHLHGELRTLAESVNDMAQRIQRQLQDQRELLAAVSHEVRSPLARLRLGAEILRADPANAQALDSIETEVVELDALVGNLLANSRLDFDTLTRQEVVAADVFRQVLSRHQLPAASLEDRSGGAVVQADPTLISRALENLLDNAERHAGAVASCHLYPGQDTAERPLVFEVRDAGPGFPGDVLPRVFDAFYRGAASSPPAPGSLGLGLSLVRRIARAHGGDAWAKNLPDRGAAVAFSIATVGALRSASTRR